MNESPSADQSRPIRPDQLDSFDASKPAAPGDDALWQCGICNEGAVMNPVAPAAGVEEEEDEPQEAIAPKVYKDPGQPTAQEREAHRATHLPYRAWCEECVMAQKPNPAHRVKT